MTVQLGDEVKETITGLKGTCTAVADWLYGCKRIVIQAKMNKDGTIPEAIWTDEAGCEITKAKAIQPKPAQLKKQPAGPRSTKEEIR